MTTPNDPYATDAEIVYYNQVLDSARKSKLAIIQQNTTGGQYGDGFSTLAFRRPELAELDRQIADATFKLRQRYLQLQGHGSLILGYMEAGESTS